MATGEGFVTFWPVGAVSWQLLPKGLLNDLFQSRDQRAAEQSAQGGDVACHMDLLGVNPHVDPSANPLQLHSTAVGGPLDTPNPEPIRDLMNHHFKAATGLSQSLAVCDAQAHQRHWFFQHTRCWAT
jgi:hypothetical protein